MISSLQYCVLSSGDKLRTHGHYSSAKSGTIPFITIQNLHDQQKLYLLCIGPTMIPSLKCNFLSRGDKLRTHGHCSSAKSGTIPFITIQNLHDQQKLCLLYIGPLMIPSLQYCVLSSGDKLRTHGHYSSAKAGTIPFITIQNLHDQQKLYLLCVGPLMIPSLQSRVLSSGDKLRTHGHYSSAKSGTIPFITIQNLNDQQKLYLLCVGPLMIPSLQYCVLSSGDKLRTHGHYSSA